MFLHVFDLTIYLHGFLLRSRFLSSSLPCVHVCLVYVNTIWTSVCSWITHDRYKIKAINVSWPGSLAILRQLFQLYPVNLPFCFRFSMKPKSIYFSGKTPVRHQNEAGLPSSISLLDPIWIPIYFFPPHPPTQSRVLAFQRLQVCDEKTACTVGYASVIMISWSFQ